MTSKGKKKKFATTELDVTFLEAMKTLLQQTSFNKTAIPGTTKGKGCGGKLLSEERDLCNRYDCRVFLWLW